jgi:predicted nucleotidyltransferase
MGTIVLNMSTKLASAGSLLFGQIRGGVLALLYGAPGEPFYIRQIAREIGASVGSVQRELTLLDGAGLIERSVLGNQVFYRANRDHPVFAELRALLAKTIGVFQLLKTSLDSLSPRIDFAFVFGSVARGEETAASDIDLMVVGDVSLDEVLDALAPLEKQLRRPVNPTIYSLRELRRGLRARNHFLRSLQNSKKVFLIGNEDEFRKARASM